MSGRPSTSRRTVLRGAALAPVAALGLTACGPDGTGAYTSATPTAPVDLGAESEVPEGGAKLYRDHNVVVSRDANGALKAYSSLCTHAQCPINKLKGTRLICPCHGSEFDATTGQVVRSPASVPLPEVPVRVQGGKLVVGPDA
jgi:nitrite reductase/ring-hydroxylating ferredoxin subunit